MTGNLDMFGRPAFPIDDYTTGGALAETISTAAKRGSAGIEFSEIMVGFIHVGPDIGEFRAATELARRNSESARFFLTIRTWDILDRKFMVDSYYSRHRFR